MKKKYYYQILYEVIVGCCANLGAVSGPKKAAVGRKVSLTFTPLEGHRLKTLKITNTSTGEEIAFDENYSFIMPKGEISVYAYFEEDSSGTYYEGQQYVDLGLTSGTKWATHNLLAGSPEDYGDYFSWGVVNQPWDFSLQTYKFAKYIPGQERPTIIDYNTPDNLQLKASDDAATKAWGKAWRIATADEWKELIDNCIVNDGGCPVTFTSKINGEVLKFYRSRMFAPNGKLATSQRLWYWTSTGSADKGEIEYEWAKMVDLNHLGSGIMETPRYYGLSIRPVTMGGDPSHDVVDLGLPSGLKWATCNIGSYKPEDFGLCYAWGEIYPFTKTYADAVFNYKYATVITGSPTYFKYTNNDNLTVLEASDDAATSILGEGWRTPTKEEIEELVSNCTFTKTTGGFTVTAENGNSIFLPYGKVFNNGFKSSSSYYLSSTRNSVTSVYGIDLEHRGVLATGLSRKVCYPIRPVYAGTEELDTYTDLGLSVKWAKCNLGATIETDAGDSYAWGEVTSDPLSKGGNSIRAWYNYDLATVDSENVLESFTKYNSEDQLTEIQPDDDAAYYYWKGQWRIPTYDQWKELIDECDWETGSNYKCTEYFKNNKYYKISKKGTSYPFIILPCAGEKGGDNLDDMGLNAIYQCRTLNSSNSQNHYILYNDKLSSTTRVYQHPIRPCFLAFTISYDTMSHGWISGVTDAAPKDVITVKVNSETGYNLKTLEATSGGESLEVVNNQFTMPSGDVFVTASFEHTLHTLSISTSEHGTITGPAVAYYGDKVTLTITPDSGYQLDTLKVMCDGKEIAVTDGVFTMPDGNVEITATFKERVVEKYVDLGLSVRWASYNVGATNPEEYGNYYAWGEIATKTTYDWSTYKYADGSNSTLTKYCSDSKYGKDGFVDPLTTLEATDDAATANWGSEWRMPTIDEWKELNDNCTWTWTTKNSVNGYEVKATNGNSIFLPAAGSRNDGGLHDAGTNGGYWSSSLNTTTPRGAWLMDFYKLSHGTYGYDRDLGQSIRPVLDPYKLTLTYDTTQGTATLSQDKAYEDMEITVNVTPSSGYELSSITVNGTAITGNTFTMPDSDVSVVVEFVSSGPQAVDLGLSVLWADRNIGATKPEDLGDFYAWGETETKSEYTLENYQYWQEPQSETEYGGYTKYCNNANFGYQDFKDDKVVLEESDDAAVQKWGNGWRMPTYEEVLELVNSATWAEEYDAEGYKIYVATINGASIKFPFAGASFSGAATWSSSLSKTKKGNVEPSPALAHMLIENTWSYEDRYLGNTIRPVKSKS